MGVASMILGIVSLGLLGTGCLGFIAPVTAFVGLVLGVVDLVLKRKSGGPKAKPVVGITLSGVAMIAVAVLLYVSDFKLMNMSSSYDPFGQAGGFPPASTPAQPQPLQPMQPVQPMQPMQPMQPVDPTDTDAPEPIPVVPVTRP